MVSRVMSLALGTGEAVVRMVGKDQLGDGLPGLDDPHGIGTYDHVRHALGGAGGSEVPTALDLYYAEAAGSRPVLYAGTLEVEMAQGRDIYSY